MYVYVYKEKYNTGERPLFFVKSIYHVMVFFWFCSCVLSLCSCHRIIVCVSATVSKVPFNYTIYIYLQFNLIPGPPKRPTQVIHIIPRRASFFFAFYKLIISTLWCQALAFICVYNNKSCLAWLIRVTITNYNTTENKVSTSRTTVIQWKWKIKSTEELI